MKCLIVETNEAARKEYKKLLEKGKERCNI